MAEELKTRLTNDQIADLEANLPLADIKGDHSDHRLKELLAEIQLVYNLSPLSLAVKDFAIQDRFTLAIGASHSIPEGRVLLAIVAGDTDFANLKLRLHTGYGLLQFDFALTAANKWTFVPQRFKSDGSTYEIYALTTEIADIQYAYEDWS